MTVIVSATVRVLRFRATCGSTDQSRDRGASAAHCSESGPSASMGRQEPGAELLPEDPFAFGRDQHGSGVGHATRPTRCQAVGTDDCSHNTREMHATLAPIEARTAQDTPGLLRPPRQQRRRCFHSDLAEELQTSVGDDAGIAGKLKCGPARSWHRRGLRPVDPRSGHSMSAPSAARRPSGRR